MQLNRNTIIPIAIGMLAIAAARAEAAPLVGPGASAGAARPAMGDALLWGLDFAAKAGAMATIDEAALAIPAMASLGEDADGAIAPEDTDVATDECCDGCGVALATWGDAVEVALPIDAGTQGWVDRMIADALPLEDSIEAAEAVLFAAPTFDAPTFATPEAPTFEVAAEGIDVSYAPMPIYVALCRAVVDAMKADLANQPEAVPSGTDESSEDGETAEDVVRGECCDDDAAAVADASDIDASSTDEQDLRALVACGDAHAALAAAGSLKRGVVRFFQTLVRTAAERHDAVLESAEVIDEVVDAPAPEFAADHVPQVLTLF